MEQLTLIDVPETRLRPIDEKAARVANFNLLAWGDYQKAIDEIEKDIARDLRMWERATKAYGENLKARGFHEGAATCEKPKRPDLAIRVKRLAIAQLERERPTPQDV